MSLLADRMSRLSPYLFAELDRKKAAAVEKGLDVISLSIGDPDLPTPEPIVKAGQQALLDPANHHYPAYAGSTQFRQAAANWMKKRFGVELDPDRELVALIGSKEGIYHLAFVLIDQGDVALCPEPGYPVYAISTRLAGGKVHYLPLLPQNDFLPDLDNIDPSVCKQAKALWICYPNNPTGAVAPTVFLERCIEFAQQHELVLCVDAAYSEITFDGYQAPSVLELPGGREVAIEFHSFSKTYNMTGWRVAFAAGRQDVIGPFTSLKSNLDSGVCTAIQQAGIKAMELWPGPVKQLCEVYRKRRNHLVAGLSRAGFDVIAPQGTFYVWMPVPGKDDVAFTSRLIEQAGVVLTPGSGFGPSGKGFVRFSLTVPEARLDEAIERIVKAF